MGTLAVGGNLLFERYTRILLIQSSVRQKNTLGIKRKCEAENPANAIDPP
jgi:hypothetical protein